ncbi:MAG: AMP-binding protein, partial [Roseiarcus sp.]
MTSLAQSYVHGASDKPLIGETIGALLDRIADEAPDSPALVVRHQSIRWTYEELRRRADDLAAGLIALALGPGERIGIWSPNNAEWVLTQFATAKAGLILVNINPAYRAHEFDYAMNKVGCKALILSPGFKGNDYIASLRALAPELDGAQPGRLAAARLPDLEIVIRLGAEKTAGALNFADVAAPASKAQLAALAALGERLQFDDPINIQFT